MLTSDVSPLNADAPLDDWPEHGRDQIRYQLHNKATCQG